MDFKNKEIERQYLEKVEHIKNLIDAPVEDTKYLWDMTVENYAKKIAQVDRVLSDKILNDKADSENKKSDDKNKDFDVRNELKSFLSRCSSPEFQIALVGTIKAGKSTLINALLNYELASTRVTPETAALTKFKHADENSVTISFYTSADWDELWKSATSTTNSVFIKDYKKLNADVEKNKWLNHAEESKTFPDLAELKTEIEKWTSSTSPSHYFVKEVVVGLKDFDLPEGVVLIDTPGLNDVVEFRSNITRDYIKRANAVLACVKADKLEGNVLKTLYQIFVNVFKNPEKVYVIATQLDTLNRPKEDWARQEIEWTKYLEEDQCYKSADVVKNNLIPVSAYFYSMLEDYKNNKIKDDDDKNFELESTLLKLRVRPSQLNERFDELEEFTNIKFLYGKLQTEIVSKYKTDLIEGIRKHYERCQENIAKVLGEKKKAQQGIINDSQLDVDEIRRKREEKLAELQEVQNDKRELSEFVRQLQAATEKRIDEVVKAIKS